MDASENDLITAQVEGKTGDLSTAQVHPFRELGELTDIQWKIHSMCERPRNLMDIMNMVRVTNRGFFKRHHLDPLIQGGIIRMTNPEHPRASNQKYVLTDAGMKLLLWRHKKVPETVGIDNE
jgi:ATP-dependent DNA helicase RecG